VARDRYGPVVGGDDVVIPVAGSSDLPAAVLVDLEDEQSGTYYVHAVAPAATLDERLKTRSRGGTRARFRAITAG
jgi:hypothetical protein